jgi:hypothetical protein
VKSSLVARRDLYQEIIARHEGTIAALETELAEINRRLEQKHGEARSLLETKQRLLKEIERNQGIATAAATYGGLLGLLSAGIATAIGAGMAATAAGAIVKFRSDLKDAERAEESVRADMRKLDAARAAHGQLQAELRKQVDGLRKSRAALEALAPEIDRDASPREVVSALKKAIAHDEQVVANLEKQIALLQSMKAQASGFEQMLDATIARLKEDVQKLERRVDESRRAVLIAMIDVAVIAFAASGALRRSGVPLAQKELLLSGLDLANGDLEQAIHAVVRRLVSEGLIAAGSSAVLGATLTGLLASASAPGDER